MRPTGLLAVAEEVKNNAEVTICSASPAMVLQPFADRLGIKLIGTTLEVVEGVLTGKIIGNNCRCGEKIKRLENIYGDLTQYHLRAWETLVAIMNCFLPHKILIGVTFIQIVVKLKIRQSKLRQKRVIITYSFLINTNHSPAKARAI